MKKIKILFFIYQMGAGGAARTLLNIINNLDRTKFEPVLVTLNFNGSYEGELKSDVKFIKLDTKRLSRSVFKLANIIRKEKINLVFSTIPRVNTIAVLATRLSFTKARCIVREADNLSGDFLTKVQLVAFGFVYKCANQVVSLSEGVKQNLVNQYKLKASDIKVVYNPIDIPAINEKIETGKMPDSHEALYDPEEKILITAGRLVEQKDQITLLRAFSNVVESIPSRLIILGEGPLEKPLQAMAKELGIKDKVHFIGFQSNPYQYFHKSDLFVLSSLHEGFSHVIAEALACATPVVSTNCKSGPEEVLDKGKYGYLCEVGDAEEMASHIVKILRKDQQDLKKIKEKGMTRAADFDARKIVKTYEQVFIETLSK
ncbi:glycosyltransferase [Alteribacter keqinensis]|uniref:Glycosyltransferase n=1 Tax=Alteribacter keqinensis TaxID=2483800 RepID=A0A3M7TQ69_9BACI|nr:glycosyltransferase [Alteribacter keqinensis]RNA67595.1 glycosyltransferase [Alteribacter keqinensis]